MCYNKYHPQKKDDKKINRSNLLEGFYDSFLLDIFYKRVTNKQVKIFIKSTIAQSSLISLTNISMKNSFVGLAFIIFALIFLF